MSELDTPPVRNDSLAVDFVADMVCPWCYLGWVRLKSAAAMRPGVETAIVWRPYQLDPSLPEDGVDRRAYMAAKFPDADRMKAVQAALTQAAADDGVTLRLDRIAKSPNTSAAHRLIRWAQGQNRQDAVVEALFTAYFEEGCDIGDPEVLADIGASAGMDRLVILDLLSREADKDVVHREHRMAVEAGVTGVPFMVFDQKFSVIGAEPAAKLVRAIDHAVKT